MTNSSDKLMALPKIIEELRGKGYSINRSFRKNIMSMVKSGELKAYKSKDILKEYNANKGGDTDIFNDLDGNSWLTSPLFLRSEIEAILIKKG